MNTPAYIYHNCKEIQVNRFLYNEAQFYTKPALLMTVVASEFFFKTPHSLTEN